MTTNCELYDLGRNLGYEGEDLVNFIKIEQNRERDFRQEQRELEKSKQRTLELAMQKEQWSRDNSRKDVSDPSSDTSRDLRQLPVPEVGDIWSIDATRMKEAQQTYASLEKWRKLADEDSSNGSARVTMIYGKGLLYRVYVSTGHKQLVLPEQMRETVMKIAHESAFGGHQGTGKTVSKVQLRLARYYWRYAQILSIVRRVPEDCP